MIIVLIIMSKNKDIVITDEEKNILDEAKIINQKIKMQEEKLAKKRKEDQLEEMYNSEYNKLIKKIKICDDQKKNICEEVENYKKNRLQEIANNRMDIEEEIKLLETQRGKCLHLNIVWTHTYDPSYYDCRNEYQVCAFCGMKSPAVWNK